MAILHLGLHIEVDDDCDRSTLMEELRAWAEEIPAVTPINVHNAELLEPDDDFTPRTPD